jgi:hypothetical protein
MKLATLAIIAVIVSPLAAVADSSQPNSAPGLQGAPVTKSGEGTTGMSSDRAYPGEQGRTRSRTGTTDAGKTGYAGTRGATDSSIPGATNPNEPMGSRR